MGAFLFFCQDLMGVAASRAGTWNPQPINGNKKRNLSLPYVEAAQIKFETSVDRRN